MTFSIRFLDLKKPMRKGEKGTKSCPCLNITSPRYLINLKIELQLNYLELIKDHYKKKKSVFKGYSQIHIKRFTKLLKIK